MNVSLRMNILTVSVMIQISLVLVRIIDVWWWIERNTNRCLIVYNWEEMKHSKKHNKLNRNINLWINPFSILRPPFLKESIIKIEKCYEYLREWYGDDEWKLIYRASEQDYTAESFHEHCDDVRGPTLIVIKSSGEWIFGGYTIQSWSGDRIWWYNIVIINRL